MGRKCYIVGCTSDSRNVNNEETFHRLNISNQDIYKEWIAAITILNNQPNVSKHPKSAVICSKHFKSDCFILGCYLGRKLKNDAIPSIFPNTQDMNNVEYIVEDVIPLSKIRNKVVETKIYDVIPSTSIIAKNDTSIQKEQSVTITPAPKRKSLRYVGDITNVANMSPQSLRNCIHLLKVDNLAKAKTIKNMQKKYNRTIKQIDKYNESQTKLRKPIIDVASKNYNRRSKKDLLDINGRTSTLESSGALH